MKHEPKRQEPSDVLDNMAHQVVDAAFHVHQNLGPGLLERVYEVCFCHELAKRNLQVERQVMVPIRYDGQLLDEGLRIDVLVGGSIICELKAVEQMTSLYEAQLLTYMRLAGRPLGFLINFNVASFKQGIKRMVLTL